MDAVQGFLTECLLMTEFVTNPVVAILFADRSERVGAIGRELQTDRLPILGVVITPVGVVLLFVTFLTMKLRL